MEIRYLNLECLQNNDGSRGVRLDFVDIRARHVFASSVATCQAWHR